MLNAEDSLFFSFSVALVFLSRFKEFRQHQGPDYDLLVNTGRELIT